MYFLPCGNCFGKSSLFQYDNAPVGKARSIKTWFSQFGVKKIDSSTQSPNFKPIQHLIWWIVSQAHLTSNWLILQWRSKGKPFSVGSTVNRSCSPVHSSPFCVCPGVHAIRVPEDERYLLGADGDGPDGAAAPDEPAGDHRLHQILSARVRRPQRQHRTRPPPALHPQRRPGDSEDSQHEIGQIDGLVFSSASMLWEVVMDGNYKVSWRISVIKVIFLFKRTTRNF